MRKRLTGFIILFLLLSMIIGTAFMIYGIKEQQHENKIRDNIYELSQEAILKNNIDSLDDKKNDSEKKGIN